MNEDREFRYSLEDHQREIDHAEERHKAITELAQSYKDDPEFFRECLVECVAEIKDISVLHKAVLNSQDPACAIINDQLSDYAVFMARENVDK